MFFLRNNNFLPMSDSYSDIILLKCVSFPKMLENLTRFS